MVPHIMLHHYCCCLLQVEFANVLVLNKSDLVTQQEQHQLLALLRKLNPTATVLTTQHCKVPAEAVLHTGAFNWEAAQASPGWVQEISKFEQQQHHHHHHHEHAAEPQHQQQEHQAGSSAPQVATSSHHSHSHNSHDHDGTHSHSHSGGHSHGDSEAAKYGISSFVYYAKRPFHPERLLQQALSQSWQGVLRSKGFYWLATRHDVMGLWQSAGGAWQGEPR